MITRHDNHILVSAISIGSFSITGWRANGQISRWRFLVIVRCTPELLIVEFFKKKNQKLDKNRKKLFWCERSPLWEADTSPYVSFFSYSLLIWSRYAQGLKTMTWKNRGSCLLSNENASPALECLSSEKDNEMILLAPKGSSRRQVTSSFSRRRLEWRIQTALFKGTIWFWIR